MKLMIRALLLVLIICCLSITSVQGFQTRTMPVKPERASVAPGFDRRHIEVKFLDDADIGLSATGELVDRSKTFFKATVNNTLAAFADAGGTWRRSTGASEDMIDQLVAQAERTLEREIADLNNYFLLTVPQGEDTEEWIDQLNALPEVEIAKALPLPMPLPMPGDYQGGQGYLNDAPGGIGAISAWAEVGGTGDGCLNTIICDFEYSWNLNHYDITVSSVVVPSGMTPSDPYSDDNHGTAVLGEMISFNNGWGTTGASYGAAAWVAPTYLDGAWQLGVAMQEALSQVTTETGVVFLIEQQMAGPNYTGSPPGTQDGLVPVEWWQSWYNTIVTCIGNGVTVVECAGNGKEDLDAPIYSTGNGGHWPFLPQNNSGAIIVGAGAVPAAFGGTDVDRSRLSFSNYGSRLDMQGWGEYVVTTGYGRLYNADGKDYWYDWLFAGTSSAAPMVASAAAILQSVYKEAGGCTPGGYGTALPPDSIRAILKRTGSPQQAGTYPTSQNIGPRPDLVAAIAELPNPCDCGDNTGADPDAVGDINCDGGTDPLDVQYLVSFVYKSQDARCSKPSCPYDCGDVNCDSGVDPLDVQFLVKFVYLSQDALCDPCSP